MSFELTKSQKAIVKSVKEFAKGEFDKERIAEMDGAGQFPDSVWKMAADLGFIGVHLPEAVGGGGMGLTDHLLVAEAFAASDSTLGSAIMLAGIGSEGLARWADNGVRETPVADILEGRLLPGTPVPRAAGGVSLAKTESGDAFLLNGEVDPVINGGSAGLYLIPLENGLAVVDADSEGVEVVRQHRPLGLRLTPAAHVRFSNATIPNDSWIPLKKANVSQLLGELRLLLAALALGTARGALDRALSHRKTREQFGCKLAVFQVLRHKVARAEVQIGQARSLMLAAADNMATRKPDAKLAAMACLAAVTAAVEITTDAIQLLGGYGYTVEYEVERCARDAKTLQLLSGSRLSLYDEIAEAAIGKIKK